MSVFPLIILLLVDRGYGWSFRDLIPEEMPCVWGECCDKTHIPANFGNLRVSFKARLYGQHLAEKVVSALESHFYHEPNKALVLSFHGGPGTGKNYVAQFIAESLFKKGLKSSFVHLFTGRLHFPVGANSEKYIKDLQETIKNAVYKCPRQLFIFDEVDKMPSNVLNSIKPYLDYRPIIDGVDHRKAIFVLLSNNGAQKINQHYYDFFQKGLRRESLTLADFESTIVKQVFNEHGGFHRSDAVQSDLIDHYVPFLPMEHQHIRMCILDSFRERGVFSPTETHINEVLKFVQWGPEGDPVFSKTGCKRVAPKVSSIAMEMYAAKNKIEL